MMADLWRQVAERYIYVTVADAWFSRSAGDRTPIKEHAAQKSIDIRFRSPKLVLSYGRNDGQVKVTHEAPKLADVTNGFLEKDVGRIGGKHRHCNGGDEVPESVLGSMVADFMDTYPGMGEVVHLFDGGRVWNLWTPPAVKAVGPAKYREPRWFLEVVERFFGEHEREREYFLDWCTHLICRPQVKMPVSVLLVSSLTGAGKGFIATALKHMVGPRNFKNVTSTALKGGFQSFVLGTTLVVINELYEQGDHSFADKLKTWQSESEQFVNIKYGPQQSTRTLMHFLAFSNRQAPLNLDEGDRRWFTFGSPQREPAPQAWWDERWRFLEDPKTGLPHTGALGSLRRWFEERMVDIDATGRFRPHERPPLTDHKLGLIEDSRSPFYARVRGLFESGGLPIAPGRHGETTIEELVATLTAQDQGFKRPPNNQIRQDLESLGFEANRTKSGRFWRVPEGYSGRKEAFEALDI